MALDKLTIKGFKSIKNLENFELKNLNVLIGANGSGKSNFLSFFEMIHSFISKNLNPYVTEQGGGDDTVFGGPKITQKMSFEMHFGPRGYRFSLELTPHGTFAIRDEAIYYEGSDWWPLGNDEQGIPNLIRDSGTEMNARNSRNVYNFIIDWRVFHFHDTSKMAGMRRSEIIQDHKTFRYGGRNIASVLLGIKRKYPKEYKEICNAIRFVMPYFDDFLLTPITNGKSEKVRLDWTQKGSDYPMQPYHLSDGTIRFICLSTVLLHPHPPSTIIIDEPELGLHPEAIAILAELIKSASQKKQLIIATQSPLLISHFSVDDIIVVNNKQGQSSFERLKEKDFEVWMKDYTIGELWEKNIINGGTNYG